MPKDKDMTIEQALDRLEIISDKLEGKQVSLEESLKLYTEATEIIKLCEDKINKARLTVKHLDMNSGEQVEQ